MGRFSGIGAALSTIADKLRKDREMQTETGQKINLLGTAGMAEGKITRAQPNEQGAFELQPGSGQWFKKTSTPEMDILNRVLGGGQGTGANQNIMGQDWKMNKIDLGPVTLERQPSQEEFKQETQREAEKQATIATSKERQVNIGKISRLKDIATTIEQKFLETSPYSGAITKTGLTPILGILDVWKSNLQATEAQINDKAYRDLIQGMRAQLARAMGDVGNLSEYEQKAAKQLMPSLLDSRETGLKKLSNLRDLIKTIEGKITTTQSQGNIGEFQTTPSGNKFKIIP